MKNKFKKLLAFAIFAIMTMAMAVTTSATTGSYTITLNEKSTTSNTYAVYKVASFDVSNNKHTNFKLVAPFDKSESEYVQGKKIKDITAEDLAAEAQNSGTLQELAIALAAENPDAIMQNQNNRITFNESGYYLIKETGHTSGNEWLATRYILVAVDGDKTIDLKTSAATIDKKILDDGKRVDANTANLGETITYEIIAQIPNYPANANADNLDYIITDQMSAGLTYTGVSKVEIFETHEDAATGSKAGTSYSKYIFGKGSAGVNTEGAKVIITVPGTDVKTNAGKFIKVTMTAKLNNNAVVGKKGNPNSVELTYTNNWDTKEKYTTNPDTVITYTGKLNIVKEDSAEKNGTHAKLQDAKFAIYGPSAAARGESLATNADITAPTSDTLNSIPEDSRHYITTITTDKNGEAFVSRLKEGTYYAIEVKAPAGYNLVSTPQKIVITVTPDGDLKLKETGEYVSVSVKGVTEANSEAEKYMVSWKNKKDENEEGAEAVTIYNTQGTTLPGTGGMGTTIFTIGGIVLVALAALMFVVYMRKQKKQA